MGKKKTPEDMILESFGKKDGPESTRFFRELSDDAYHGFVTASILQSYPKIGISVNEIYKLVKKLC